MDGTKRACIAPESIFSVNGAARTLPSGDDESMTKISMVQVYGRILERQDDEIAEREARGHEAMGYTFDQFAQDMRARDFISSLTTIKNKWDAMTADRVLDIPARSKPYARGVLWIAPLKAAAQGRVLARATLPDNCQTKMCVSQGFIYENETDAEEESE